MKNSSNTGNVLMSCQPHEEKKKGKEKSKAGPELENFNTDCGWRVWGGCPVLSHDCFVLGWQVQRAGATCRLRDDSGNGNHAGPGKKARRPVISSVDNFHTRNIIAPQTWIKSKTTWQADSMPLERRRTLVSPASPAILPIYTSMRERKGPAPLREPPLSPRRLVK